LKRTLIAVAPKDYLDKMIAEPFEPFTFPPVGAAVFQLGPYGTAAKQLKDCDLKRGGARRKAPHGSGSIGQATAAKLKERVAPAKK
jgi:hypothetical protein